MDNNQGTVVDGQILEKSQSNAGIHQEPPPKEGPPEYSSKKEAAEEILKVLASGTEEVVVLTGEEGTGKTWLAQEITKSALNKGSGSFYMSLWISVNQDKQSVHQSIARQLCIPTRAEVWEDDDGIDTDKKEDYVDTDTDSWNKELKHGVLTKLREKIDEMLRKKNEGIHTLLLLVLDSDERVIKTTDQLYDYKAIMTELFDSVTLKNDLGQSFNMRVLITTREIQQGSTINGSREIKIKPLLGADAEKFLKERVRNDVSECPKFKEFSDAIKNRSKVLPAQIIMLAEALNHIQRDSSEALERAFDAALNILQRAETDDPIPLLHFTYEKLAGDSMIDCFWHCWKFLGKHGSVHYNQLITQWMLEGHLDPAVGLKKAYENGYDVMMRLIDRGMLKMQGGNLVALEAATLRSIKPGLTLEDLSYRGLFDKSNLGLASVLGGESSKVLKRMAPTNGMMKTVSVGKDSVSSLLIDGSRLCREVPETFFQSLQKLQILALFQHRLTSLPKFISEMESLLVFVLRDCSLLNDVQGIKNLKNLLVLEISGSPSLKEIPEVVFKYMSKLRSLNLSGLGITSLPQTVSDLTELRRLIIRRCSSLEALPKLGKLIELEVIDLSGSSSLIKIQEKSFKSLKKLQVIDFSGTKIEKLPIVQTLPELKLLSAKGCDHLSGLRLMRQLPSLKVLDFSGATKIKEIQFDCFAETDNLRILDLSETEIRFLPDSLGKHLCDLRLKDCSMLERLSNTKDLNDLESLDLSNASSLQKFPNDFFENLNNLQSLNLSNTKVESLPSLSNLQKLHRLFLKHCSFKTLPEFEKLTSLVELDLSNCENLEELPSLTANIHLEIINLSSCRNLSKIGDSFEHMSQLQVLNLSETQITCIPSLCIPSKLRSLILRNCTKLKDSPKFEILPQLEQLDLRGTTSLEDINVESLNYLKQLQTLKLSKSALDQVKEFSWLAGLTTLHVLDLSGEAVESLSPLDSLSNLQQLLLRGCSSLKELPSLKSLSHLEVLDLSGTKVEKVGDKISEFTQLKHLYLPEKLIEEFKSEVKKIEESNGGNVKFPPLELKFDRCCISKSSEFPKGAEKKPSEVVLMHSTELFKSLKEDHNLLDSIKSSRWTISSVHSSKTQGKCEDNYGDSRRHIFSDIYSNIKLHPQATNEQFLEIEGFDDFPNDIEVVLEQASYIILVENQFSTNLSDLKPSSLKNMKGCWVERCTNVESIFTKIDLETGEKLEILWISNLPNLKSLFKTDLPSKSFGNLKNLYIACCPTLETVFSSAQLPPNLETLQIMFCDKLKTVFEAKASGTSEVQAMSSTGKEVQPTSSENKDSANLVVQTKAPARKETQNTTSADKKVQNTSSKDTPPSAGKKEETETPSSEEKEKEVQTAHSEDKGVQTTSSEDKEGQTIVKLKYLQISYCPMLETVFSSAQLPETLEALQIKFCGKLKSLSGQELNWYGLRNLQTLHLEELPGWTVPTIRHECGKKTIKKVKGWDDIIPVEESLKTGKQRS